MDRPASLPLSPTSERFHVVLVEPGDSLNVGAVARAMSNLGFAHLHLVAPPRLDLEKAATTACWATDLLSRAQVHERLEDALAPMRQVVGFTARHGRHRPRHLLLPEWTDELAGHGPEETALVFGPEDHGLRAKHVEHCRWLVRIPSTAANPSYNLAQSVLLVLFELSRLQWAEIPRETGGHRPPWRDFYQLERIVAEVLTRVGFFGKGTPTPVPGLVKHLLRRIDPDRREMQVLLGMFGRIHGALSGRIPLQPLEERPARRRAPPAKPKRRGAGPAEPTAQEEQKEGRRLPGAGSL